MLQRLIEESGGDFLIINLLHATVLSICAGSKIIDRDESNKRKEDENLRLRELSAQELYDEKNRKFLKRLSR